MVIPRKAIAPWRMLIIYRVADGSHVLVRDNGYVCGSSIVSILLYWDCQNMAKELRRPYYEPGAV